MANFYFFFRSFNAHTNFSARECFNMVVNTVVMCNNYVIIIMSASYIFINHDVCMRKREREREEERERKEVIEYRVRGEERERGGGRGVN